MRENTKKLKYAGTFRPLEMIVVLLSSVIVIVIGLPLGLHFMRVEGLEGLGQFLGWLVCSPGLLISSFIANYIFFYLIERVKKAPLKLILIFLLGMIIPIIINILFWANINIIWRALFAGKN